MDTFEGENMQTQYIVLCYRIDLYFHDYKLAVKLMNEATTIEMKFMKQKDKKQLKKCLIVSLSELILTNKTLTSLRPKTKYLGTLKKQIKDL